MKCCWVYSPHTPFDTMMHQASLADQLGFDSVLLVSLDDHLDPWIVGTSIAASTKNIRLLVAQNTNHVLPTLSVKALNTLNLISGNRADLNVVTGSSRRVLSKHAKAEDHGTRYRRTKEFVEVVRALRHSPTSYHGEFFQISNMKMYPGEDIAGKANLFISGSSDEAIRIAAELGDYYLQYAVDTNTLTRNINTLKRLAAENRREVRCGMLIDVIARETSEEAWETARRIVANAPAVQKRLTRFFQNEADSQVNKANKLLYQYKEQGYVVDRHIWGGFVEISTTSALSIVGSYAEVIAAIQRYKELGIDYFLFSGYANENEIERIGRHILPFVK